MNAQVRIKRALGALNPNVSEVLVHTVGRVEQLRPGVPPGPVSLRTFDPADPEAMLAWSDLLLEAFPDEPPPPGLSSEGVFDPTDDPWFTGVQVFGIEEGGRMIAAVSVGNYRSKPAVTGVRRIAVRRSERGQGWAGWVTVTALQEAGAEHVELISRVKRLPSLRMQAKLGLRLQEDWSQVVPTGQRRLPAARAIALRRARKAMTGG